MSFIEILCLYEVYQVLMIIVNCDGMFCSDKVYLSFFQCLDDGHEFLVINRIVEFGSMESL